MVSECSIGELLPSNCEHKGKKIILTKYSELSKQDQTLVRLRSRLPKAQIKAGSTLCFGHYRRLLDDFARNVTRCCDPFNIHANSKGKTKFNRAASRLTELTIEHYNHLKQSNIEVIPGHKICRRCNDYLVNDTAYRPPTPASAATAEQDQTPQSPRSDLAGSTTRQTRQSTGRLPRPGPSRQEDPGYDGPSRAKQQALETTLGVPAAAAPDYETPPEGESQSSSSGAEEPSFSGGKEHQRASRDFCNTCLDVLGISPVKVHGVKGLAKCVLGKRKVDQAVNKIVKRVANGLGVDEEDVRPYPKCSLAPSDLLAYERFLAELKIKIEQASSREKISLLTIAPLHWGDPIVAEKFSVSEYQVREARNLKAAKNIILPEVTQKQGRPLDSSVVDSITDFFEEDGVSKLAAGAGDTISVKINEVRVRKQKRYLLMPLKETYLEYKKCNPDVKVGFSKFASLRPKWCLPISAPGAHNVCVCTIHQNLILMIAKLGKEKMEDGTEKIVTYAEVFDKLVCSRESRKCMVERCENCPGSNTLREYLRSIMIDGNTSEHEEITYKHWTQGKGAEFDTRTATINNFIEILIEEADKATSHHYISKNQASYLRELKLNLPNDTAIVLLYFAENYTCVVQDSSQAYYFQQKQATLHPAVFYFHKDGSTDLTTESKCIISDELTHDNVTVNKFQHKFLIPFKEANPHIKKIIYFSDGAGSQYKNYKNLINLCNHERDFGLKAEWHFFATSHGKSPCDGVGATAKRSASDAAKRARLNEGHILNAWDLFQHCRKNVNGIEFIWCAKQEVDELREELQPRFDTAKTVVGTRSQHRFVPESEGVVRMYRLSSDTFSTRSSVTTANTWNQAQDVQVHQLHVGDHIACDVSGTMSVGVVAEIADDEEDVTVRMMKFATKYQLAWPAIAVDVIVSIFHVLSHVQVEPSQSVRETRFKVTRVLYDSLKAKHAAFKDRNK